MITWGDVRRWRPDAVGAAGEQLRADLRVLERAADEVRARVVPGSWVGLASILARSQQRRLVAVMDAHVEGARGLVRAAFAAEGTVQGLRELVVEIDHDARAQQFEIDSAGTVSDVSPPRSFDTAREADAHLLRRTVQRDALVSRIEEVLARAHEVDSALVRARPDDAFHDAGPEGVVDPEVERDWARMTDDERRAVLEQMARELADDYGLGDFTVRIEDLEDQDGDGSDDNPETDSRGSWSEDDRILRLDLNDLDDPDLIDTMAHEVRHAFQHEMVRDNDPGAWDDLWIGLGTADDPWDPPAGVTRDDAETWADNFEDYRSPADDFDAYWDQPVEVDAREAGADYLDDLTGDDLDRHREAAR